MNHTSIRSRIAFVSLALLLQSASAQSLSQLTLQALSASPTVAAKRLQVQEAESLARSAGSPLNPEFEVAPSIGNAYGNLSLSQKFDLFGTRSATARRFKAEIKVAHAGLREAELAAAHQFHLSYAKLLSGSRNVANAEAAVRIATETLAAVRRRVELGEAPGVQATRAQIELRRAEQVLIESRNELAVGRAAVAASLGLGQGAELPVVDWKLNLPTENHLGIALAQRPEALHTGAALEVAKASEVEARRLGRPTVSAGITNDAWSFDQRPLSQRNFGAQVRLTMPLFDRGANRHSVQAAKSATGARVAERESAERQIRLDVSAALSDYEAIRQVEANYSGGILPEAERMLRAMQDGYQRGLVTFLEVLEAQRALMDLMREASVATRDLHDAEARLLRAVGQLPVEGGAR